MSSPWGKTVNETVNLLEIMSEQHACSLHEKETEQSQLSSAKSLIMSIEQNTPESSICEGDSVCLKMGDHEKLYENFHMLDIEDKHSYIYASSQDHTLDSPFELSNDAVIAQLLQSQFDYDYNESLLRIERQHNKKSKVTVTLDKFRRNGAIEFLCDTAPPENLKEQDCNNTEDWDRFEANEKKLVSIPKCGFKVDKNGEMITKHDLQLCGVRNACRVMSLPPEVHTGDGAGFDMKLSNQVFNQLKTHSFRSGTYKKIKMNNRKGNIATAEMSVDSPTRLLLYKLINNKVLEQINGIISTGKEAVILHANASSYSGVKNDNHSVFKVPLPKLLPKECAIKIFKTTLNKFKQRDRYINDDYRFKGRLRKQNQRDIIPMWAEKEMHNLIRMQSVGLNVPTVVVLKKHVLVMSFIGDKQNAAPKLKDCNLSDAELRGAYENIVYSMRKLYNEANLVHADLSEFNILWYQGNCWFIDVAQSVELHHPSAQEFLLRDCANIIQFFEKRGVQNIYSKEELFKHITGRSVEMSNMRLLDFVLSKQNKN